MEAIFDIILDTAIDCLRLVPFLFLTVLLMEWIEHRAGDRFVSLIKRAGRVGPVLGAGLGLVPQCGFSAACSELFNGGLVTAGTLVAVFLSTSDEALPVLLANPAGVRSVAKLIAAKVIIAVIAGFAVDLIWSVKRQQQAYLHHAVPHLCESDEEVPHILLAALKRTGEILGFLALFTFIISLLVSFIGEEALAKLLLPGPLQPVIAAVIGFIPNCAASVLLTRLYLDGMISFGAAVAGLCSAAGIGLLVLLRGHRRLRDYLYIISGVFVSAVVSGILLQLF
ncbi:MAG: putative manganese transporter [Clostridia bacterium]|nr:putative manganese transporter [Clostridia bacterium]